MKKTDVYVVVDTPKKAKKLKRVLDMFGEKYGIRAFDLFRSGLYDSIEFNHSFSIWIATTFETAEKFELKEISIKELRNILAKEHLKAGDVCLFDDRKGFRSIGVFDKYSEEYTDFLVSKVPGKDSVRYGFHDFIRYATEEEKALLEPKKELEVGKWYVASWYHDPNDVIGVYLIDKINNDDVWFKYGVNIAYNYWSERDWYSKTHNWRLANPQEVEQALVEEARRRGHAYIEYDYNPIENELCGISKGRLESVFCDGHWGQPVYKFTDSDVAIVERLHDTLLDNHGYSLESKLLTDARDFANKIKSNIK